jgi:hypothetical protein
LIPYAAAASIILFIEANSFVFTTDEELTVDSLSDLVEIEYYLILIPHKRYNLLFEDDDL